MKSVKTKERAVSPTVHTVTEPIIGVSDRGSLARRGMTARTLRAFFGLSFGLMWGIAALLLLFTDQVEAIFGEITMTNPLLIIAVYSPGFAGVYLVWRYYGLKGLASYFRRLTLWRMSAAWWLFLVFGMPALFYTGAALAGTLNDPFPFSPWHGVLPALGIALFIGPIEEFGWRAVAQPLLQRRMAPIWAGVTLGAIWGVWHVPAFLASGTEQSAWAFGPFFVGLVAMSVILTPMFNAAKGSILVAALFHFQMNGPAWPDAAPWDTVVFVLAAAVVVFVNRKTMFTRDGAVQSVLMPGDEEINHV